MFVVDELEKYLDPNYADELSSVTAKTDAIIAGKFLLSKLSCFIVYIIC